MLAATLGILLLTPENFVIGTAELYGAARAVVEKQTLLAVAPLDLFSESVRVAAVRKCAGDGKCFLAQFEESGTAIDLLLTVSVAELEDRLLLGVRLIDAKSGADLATGGGELSSGARLDAALEPHLARLFPASIWGQIAAVELASEPSGALARAGDRTCTTPCRWERIAPGKLEVLFQKEGFVDQRATVVLEPLGAARLHPRLTAVAPSDSSLLESPIFWVSLAAGVALASAGLILIVSSSGDQQDTVCITNPGQCR